jgi:hypothetical protein
MNSQKPVNATCAEIAREVEAVYRQFGKSPPIASDGKETLLAASISDDAIAALLASAPTEDELAALMEKIVVSDDEFDRLIAALANPL